MTCQLQIDNARLGLARALAAADDTAKARTAYQDFLTLWIALGAASGTTHCQSGDGTQTGCSSVVDVAETMDL